MNVAAPTRVVVLSGIVIALAGCGGGARRQASPADPPPAVVKDLQVPDNPYRIIYNPPGNLAKPPDTTAHRRQPGRERPRRGLASKSETCGRTSEDCTR